MRMSREEAAKNRDRVVQTASEMFRESGYEGIGIATLMKAAGLTNGAFYKQFDSKEALIAEATEYGLKQNVESWHSAIENAENDPLQAVADWYLSPPHILHRGKGCTYAALANEAPRHQDNVRKAFDQGVDQTLSLLTDACDAEDSAENERAAVQTFCRLVGALVLVRAVGDPKMVERILTANKSPS